MKLDRLPLRPDLIGMEPYGAPQLDVAVRLNVNENPYPPSAALCEELGQRLSEAARDLNRYPDREAMGLRTALAGYLGHGITPEQVWPANGSNEIMTQLLTAFGGPARTVLTFGPTYSMYPEYARNTLTDYVELPREADFSVSAQTVLAAIEAHQPSVVLLANPNNPTGTVLPLTTIDEICATTSTLIVVDEAYQEFANQPSAITLLPRHDNLIVSRTMSKAFAMSGGRLGYLVASPQIVDVCRVVRLPYHLSLQTQVVAQVAIEHADELLARVQEISDRLREFTAWLRSAGFHALDSGANFVLFGRFGDRHAVWLGLLERGILIRETGPEGYLRATVGTADEMELLKQALVELNPERRAT